MRGYGGGYRGVVRGGGLPAAGAIYVYIYIYMMHIHMCVHYSMVFVSA